jgi:hypothetical protein
VVGKLAAQPSGQVVLDGVDLTRCFDQEVDVLRQAEVAAPGSAQGGAAEERQELGEVAREVSKGVEDVADEVVMDDL